MMPPSSGEGSLRPASVCHWRKRVAREKGKRRTQPLTTFIRCTRARGPRQGGYPDCCCAGADTAELT
eukprot:846151-Prorocentrum_lima.AAC.1